MRSSFRRLLAEPVALGIVEPPRDADALAVRRVHHVAAGDRQIHRQPRPLGLQRVLDDLDNDLLAGLQHLGDLAAVPPGAAAPAGRLDARQHDLVDMQEAVLLEPDVDERGLESSEHVVDPALVDVADDRARSAALQIQLGYVISGRGLRRPATLARARRLRRGLTVGDRSGCL